MAPSKSEDVMKCNRCSLPFVQVDRYGSVDVFRCSRCGFERHVHFTPNPDEIWMRDERKTKVIIKWNSGSVSASEIMALRQILPNFKKHSIQDLLRKLRDTKTFELGVFFLSDALELQRSGQELGLTIELV